MAWHDLVGLVGVAIVLTAYTALQTQKMTAESLHFSLLNVCGTALVMVSLVVEFNFSAFVMETCWLLLSIYGLWRWINARKRAS